MELEGIRSIAMRGIALEVFGQIDNIDCLKRTFLNTYATPDAERFGEVGDFRFGCYLNA